MGISVTKQTDLYTQALQSHQAGQFDAARDLYAQVVAANSEHWDAVYLLGTLEVQAGRFQDAISLLQRVSAARPDVPDAANNLGVAYQAVGEWEHAARAFEAAVRVDPEYHQALFNLGALMAERGRHADAEKCFRRAHQLTPGDPNLQFRWALALSAQQKWSDAEEQLRSPARGDINAGIHLAYVLARQEKLNEAAEVYQEILAQRPEFHEVHNSLSYVLERQGRLSDAEAAARRAIELAPDYADGYNNLGIALRSLHRLDEACTAFRRAMELAGDFPLAEFNLGTTRLLAGDFAEGWPGYARYAETLENPPRSISAPRWQGEAIPGRTILITVDQGRGDTLQFARWLPEVKARSQAEVLLESPPELVALLQHMDGIDRVVFEEGEQLACDDTLPLSLVPSVLGVDAASLSAGSSYLSAPPEARPPIAELLDAVDPDAFKVGLCWQGNPQQARDIVRSCRLETLLPLSEIDGVTWVCLQTGEKGRSQMRADWPMLDAAAHVRDFADTAAVIGRLDLVVTVDTAVAHLAGALGRPVWTLLCHTPDWRWFLDRPDSPWYPSMRLFRQPAWGDWDSVVREVSTNLRAMP